MNARVLITLPALVLLSGCETMQTRQQTNARQQAATRVAEERLYKMQGQMESLEMEYTRLMQEMEQLRVQARSSSSQISQLNSRMQALEAKQQREMQDLITRVEKLLSDVASRPTTTSRGSGREHTVERGHTLSAIAAAYGTTVDAIKKANNLTSDNIIVGQKLFIPDN
jgi:LysM repeat protein